MDAVRKLLDAIDSYLRGESEFKEFQKNYSQVYLDELPDSLLDNEAEILAEIFERSEWVGEPLTSEERGYGWRSPREFFDWLSQQQDGIRQVLKL